MNVQPISVLAGIPAALRVIIYGGVLILAVLGLSVGLLWLRRRLYSTDGRAGAVEAGFSIEKLEIMHLTGQISESEFKRLRTSALGLAGEAGGEDNSSLRHPAGSDDEKTGEAGGEDPRAEEE